MSDAEIVKEFLVESYENLDRLDQDLIALEKDPGSRETLSSIFRTIHTIKGTSGFLAFNQLEAVTHVGESLLARLRDGLLALNPEITTALLSMVDAVRQMLGSIEASGTEGERNDQELIATLTRLLEGNAEAKTAPAPAPVEEEPQPTALPQPVQNMGDILISRGAAKASEVRDAVEQQNEGDPRHVGEILVEKGAVKPQDVVDALHTQQQARGQSASDSTIRVDVGQLDRLMNRVGELVLLRNQIVQYTNSSEDSELLGTAQRLNLLTTELQEGVMKTRMQPIGNIWSKFPRTVRDVALSCGKQVRIEMEGKDTELDKTIIEAIKDPLTHLVRNAVDHGIEPPAVRQAAGKEPEGRLFLRAFHEGGQVNIEITDDGAGLDYEKIRNKAIQKALISADQAARMTEREITNLIFLPGFSTAEKVTNVSGRGVGMDVVKTNIEKIGGTVDVQSKPGQGSTVRMKIPLTLAIIPALIVTTAGDRYAIPQVSLLELVRLEGEQVGKGIELVNGAPVYRLRGRLLPLVYLKRELQADAPAKAAASQQADQLDFTLVRDKHRQWVKTLQQVLDGKLVMTPEQAGSHESCALGKWIYGAGLREWGEFSDTHVLEETHRHFHDGVRRVLTLKLQGDLAQAAQELVNVEHGSEKIMQLLTAVEKRVLDLENVNIVVLRADDRQFGLVVDEINDTEEIVVKPLGKQLKSINTYAGATIMGDGKVALILDVLGLAQRANVVSEIRDQVVTEKEETQAAAMAGHDDFRTVLLFQNGARERMAIELSQVARLEEFAHDAVEIAGGQEVVQYRGKIMPLVRVSGVLESKSQRAAEDGEGSLQVVVYSENGRSVGLVIDRILDIVQESFRIQPDTGRPGVLGSAVIQKRITGVLDVQGLLAAAEAQAQAVAEAEAPPAEESPAETIVAEPQTQTMAAGV
jgi:two-component system chemotaxis sensor kinase CheA